MSQRKQKRKGEKSGDCCDHSRSQKAYFVLGLTHPCTILHSVFLIIYDFAKVHIINENKSSIQRLDNLPNLTQLVLRNAGILIPSIPAALPK